MKLALVAALAVLVALDVRDDLARPVVETSLPVEVRGTWFTSASQYVSRRLELLSPGLLFQIGGATLLVTRHDIVRIERFPQVEGTLFHIDYVDAGEHGTPLVLEFIYRPGDPAEIVFPHQRDVAWTRVRTATAHVVQGAADVPDVVVPLRRPH